MLKIVHILQLNKVWRFDNPTHKLLRQISVKPEIKEYVIAYEMRQLKLKDDKKNISSKLKSSFNNDSDGRVTSFQDMNLSDDLLRGIKALGYRKPSPIQQRAIVASIKGRDVIAQAQSGTGKTAAFAIAILQRIDTSLNECQALILAPTRELAQQIHEEICSLSQYMRVRSHTSIGGTYTDEDADSLTAGHHIVVGTPGRIMDMMEREALRTHCIKIFVLDESDQLLDLSGRFCLKKSRRGFKNQIFDVFRSLEPSVQVFLSSATMPLEILQMSQLFMKNPERILVKDEELTLEGLSQFYVMVGQENFKFDVFLDLYLRIRKNSVFESSKIQAFVYCNRKLTVDVLVQKLENDGIVVAHMHGDMHQHQRESILNDFRKGWSRVLITTDLLGRGIDVKEVELVINYDLPDNRETYIHRVGRSGRFGRVGKAISFVTQTQIEELAQIQKFYNTEVKELPDDLSRLF